MQLSKEHLKAMDCIMVQQMIDLKLGKKLNETVKCAARGVEA